MRLRSGHAHIARPQRHALLRSRATLRGQGYQTGGHHARPDQLLRISRRVQHLRRTAIGVGRICDSRTRLEAGRGQFDRTQRPHPLRDFWRTQGRGFPGGATGVYQAVEAATQLRGQAEANQTAGAKYGLIQSLGGPASIAISHVLQRLD